MSEAEKYMIRVTVDVPLWAYSEIEALDNARHIVRMCHTACKIIDSVIVPPKVSLNEAIKELEKQDDKVYDEFVPPIKRNYPDDSDPYRGHNSLPRTKKSYRHYGAYQSDDLAEDYKK